ncbi:hypothetical protein BGZ83_008808 [Gryganskiella cystojenkinii]|nr:hypothetical protein BGZ83_008808 [Gryganskiella cystojenkinii]
MDLPANENHSPVQQVLTVLFMIVKPVLGTAKFLVVGMVATGLMIVETLGLVLTPLGPVRKLYHRFVSAFFLRIILGLLGFFWIKTEVVTLKRGRAGSSRQHTPARKNNTGELIISNWSSYIDVLYLAFRYDPVFTQIYSDTLTVRPISLMEALKLSGSYPELSPPAGVETLPLLEFVKAQHKRNPGQPVVVFPEGTTTNNRAILKFVPIFKDCAVPETSIDIKILALKYDYHKFAPTFTVGLTNAYYWGHLFRTCAQFYNRMSVKILNPEESPSNSNFSTMDGLASTPANAAAGVVEPVEEDVLGGVIMNLMGRLTRYRKLGLNVKDKADFLDYFILRNNGISSRKASTQQQQQQKGGAAPSSRPKRG